MPTMPSINKTKVNTVKMMNAIRAGANANYQSLVPVANEGNSRRIGSILVNSPVLMNDWLGAIINRVAKVIITSKMYRNPWGFMKKGYLEFGETVEEIFVDVIDGFTYNDKVAEEYVHKMRDANVKAVFHVQNFKVYYPLTIKNAELRKAFLSWAGVEDLIGRIVESMYKSMQYDEFNVMKYMLAKAIVSGHMHVEYGINFDTQENSKKAITAIKGVSNALEFMSPDYNSAGVRNFATKEDQFLILSAKTDAVNDVEVLASAFNMGKVEFMGHRMTIDSFANVDEERLTVLFSNEKTGVSTFVKFTEAEKAILETINAVIVDRNWFQIYENLVQFAENFNGNNISWNYFLHFWATFSYSPFANAIAFTSSDTQTITGVTAGITSKVMTEMYTQFTIRPEIESAGLIAKNYSFIQSSAMEENGVTITEEGVLTLPANAAGVTLQMYVDGDIYTASETIDGTAEVGTTTITFAKG